MLRFVPIGALAALALAGCVAGCGSTAKPLAGSPAARTDRGAGEHAKLDDPRTNHLKCLKAHGIPVSEPTSTEIQVGQPGVGPLIRFLQTAGAAQEAQISGEVQGAEVIGAALLYPNATTSNSELTTVETCTALGVKG